jgi:hypothetical protein
MEDGNLERAKQAYHALSQQFLVAVERAARKNSVVGTVSDLAASLKASRNHYLTLLEQHTCDCDAIDCLFSSAWYCVPFTMKCMSANGNDQYFGYVEIYLDGLPYNDKAKCAAGFYSTQEAASSSASRLAEEITLSLSARSDTRLPPAPVAQAVAYE